MSEKNGRKSPEERAPELYRRYRPSSLSGVMGQATAVKALQAMVTRRRVPHALLLTGPSGTGKTTIARILKAELGCSDPDYCEVNCAVVDGAIETVRKIQSRMGDAPVAGPCRVWLLDEVQSLSRAQFAQQALLKMLEDTPSHVYFLLATTDPGKVLKTIQTRCTKVALGPLTAKDLSALLGDVVRREGADVSQSVVDRIVEAAEGSAREALVLLGSVIGLEGEEEQVRAVTHVGAKKQAIDLARSLINPRSDWGAVGAVLEGIDEDPESVRKLLLAYAGTVLVRKGTARAYGILSAFDKPAYDGKAALIRAAWEVVNP